MSPQYTNWHYFKNDTAIHYSKLRIIDKKVISEEINILYNLIHKFSSSEEIVRVVDAGVGKGRLFIPLLKKTLKMGNKCNLIGIDLSPIMLFCLLENVSKYKHLTYNSSWNILRLDLQKQWPFPDSYIHIIYQFATFHILTNWRDALKEVNRVLCPGGYFVYIKEFNQVFHSSELKFSLKDSKDYKKIKLNPQVYEFFKYYHNLRTEMNYPYTSDGGIEYSNIDSLKKFLKSENYKYEIIKNKKMEWLKLHTFRDIIHAIKFARVTTLGSELPDNVRKEISKKLLFFCKENKIDINKSFKIPAFLEMHIFQKEI